MAGLWEGGNEPPGSLKANAYANSGDDLTRVWRLAPRGVRDPGLRRPAPCVLSFARPGAQLVTSFMLQDMVFSPRV
ncbi:hypothetical protein ANN_08347 [Periplaneta americana]|uniref:Uncharacterized protein n=1 Tax=Periplaneta americana TaxID=6978 RepID=A0ABQ8T2J0_PERAM|nr:hypothetical protein ANN_08347 [Periplaneta americana]